MNLQLTELEIIALNSIAAKCHLLAIEKGWYDEPETEIQFLARHCANVHGEVSELWEAARKGQLKEPCDKGTLNCGEEESADILIRVFDACSNLGIDIGNAVAIKHDYNATRPKRHGGKLA
jgi:NTP pyrophosphatase (non-canonical NTP hydrolase)